MRDKKRAVHFRDCKMAQNLAGLRGAVGSASGPRVRSLGFDTRSGHLLSYLLTQLKQGQLSVTGESMCT